VGVRSFSSLLHLPGVMMAQNAAGQRVYLLNDSLGNIRQVISGTTVVNDRSYNPYGFPGDLASFTPPYGYTGE